MSKPILQAPTVMADVGVGFQGGYVVAARPASKRGWVHRSKGRHWRLAAWRWTGCKAHRPTRRYSVYEDISGEGKEIGWTWPDHLEGCPCARA